NSNERRDEISTPVLRGGDCGARRANQRCLRRRHWPIRKPGSRHRGELRQLPRHRRQEPRRRSQSGGTGRRGDRATHEGVPRRSPRGHRHAAARQGLHRCPDRSGGGVLCGAGEAMNRRDRVANGSARTTRREFLKAASASFAAVALGAHSNKAHAAVPRVVVVGAGYGGATAAKYIRKWSGGRIEVTVVEREVAFVSCPTCNLVIGGSRQLADITVPFDGLAKWGVRIVRDEALDIDPGARSVKLGGGETLGYDRLILSPGVDFIYDDIPSLASPEAQARVLHAWKAGPQTAALRAQLEAMPDGGVFAIHIPKAPFRCPPAPYERACQVAYYFSTRKKKSRIIVLDANEEIQAKKAFFTGAWESLYKGYVDYRPNSALVDVDLATRTLKLDFENVTADVINVVPPQRAGAIARRLGMANANDRFCQVDFL